MSAEIPADLLATAREWAERAPGLGDYTRATLDSLARLIFAERERCAGTKDALVDALRKYADPENWGYVDDSGCPKGHGEYDDTCFIGPAVARAALKAAEGEG